jgi:hypothetical protein
MEFNNHSFTFRSEASRSGGRKGAADVTAKAGSRIVRKPSLRTNFSYPRPSRHEPSDSRSSNGSVPGMTDASDSDLSFDDDCVYNTSAGQLWDSFWPNSTDPSAYDQPQELDLQQTRQQHDYFKVDTTKRYSSEEDGDTIKVSPREQNAKVDELATPSQKFRTPQWKPTPKKSAVTYSIYPEPPVQREVHPPRTSSLNFDPPSPPQQSPVVRSSKSIAALRPSKSTRDIHRLFIAPSLMLHGKTASPPSMPLGTVSSTASSVPVSPAYPPPPPPKTLRPSNSAFNLRDINAGAPGTAPLPALLPSALPQPQPRPPPQPARPQMERFVSVFELDSDSESEDEAAEESHNYNNSLAKRIARGLHKKSASEKRGGSAGFGGSFGSDGPDKDKDSDEKSKDFNSNFSRKRGGSLGRIFGLMGR